MCSDQLPHEFGAGPTVGNPLWPVSWRVWSIGVEVGQVDFQKKRGYIREDWRLEGGEVVFGESHGFGLPCGRVWSLGGTEKKRPPPMGGWAGLCAQSGMLGWVLEDLLKLRVSRAPGVSRVLVSNKQIDGIGLQLSMTSSKV